MNKFTFILPSLAAASLSQVTRRYRGLSGKKGNTVSETRHGSPVKASKTGHKLSVPKIKRNKKRHYMLQLLNVESKNICMDVES